jgi:hypothetical protein
MKGCLVKMKRCFSKMKQPFILPKENIDIAYLTFKSVKKKVVLLQPQIISF